MESFYNSVGFYWDSENFYGVPQFSAIISPSHQSRPVFSHKWLTPWGKLQTYRQYRKENKFQMTNFLEFLLKNCINFWENKLALEMKTLFSHWCHVLDYIEICFENSQMSLFGGQKVTCFDLQKVRMVCREKHVDHEDQRSIVSDIWNICNFPNPGGPFLI